MAAKIAILGESTSVTRNSETTLYTVPADKSARVRVYWVVESGSGGSNLSLRIGSPGSENTIKLAIGSSTDTFSGSLFTSTPDPSLSLVLSAHGTQEVTGIEITATGTTTEMWGAPLGIDYFLTTGDTVKFYNSSSTDAVDALYQVVGVEDDV